MPKLSALIAPNSAVYRFRGNDINFKYDAALLTQEYIDQYSSSADALDGESAKPSQRMDFVRENLVRRIKWVDVQDDDNKNLTPSKFLDVLDFVELQDLSKTIGEDIGKRQSPTPPTEGSSSSGSPAPESSTPTN